MKPMSEKIDVELKCVDCDRLLKSSLESDGVTIVIKPCENCLQKSYDNGYRQGLTDADGEEDE
jgi:hypothetical protein